MIYLADSFREFIPLSETVWQDLLTVPAGYCSSYAIIPVDRTGATFNNLANVSMENGTSPHTFVEIQHPLQPQLLI